MRLPNGETLMHDAIHAYDPVKAHQYYLKTRELKGRKKGRAVLTPAKGPAKGLPAANKLLGGKQPPGVVKTKPVDPKVIQKKRKQIKERIAQIRKELADLNARLKEKMAEAREAEAKEKAGPTTAEKADAARESKKYRDKNAQKIANKAAKGAAKEKSAPEKPEGDTVESLKADIANVQGRLKAAQQKLSATKIS